MIALLGWLGCVTYRTGKRQFQLDDDALEEGSMAIPIQPTAVKWSDTMPKVIPVPDELSQPFWDAVNQKRLVLQHCTTCDRLQYPPQQTCQVCGSAAQLAWKEVKGRGHIATYIVIEDGRLNRRMPDQPYNLALITLDEDPRINFYSNLPGTPPYEVPVGAAVAVIFEEVAPGQLVHEWRVID